MKVLIVEDSKVFGRVLSERLEAELNIENVGAKTFAETEAILEDGGDAFFVGLVDLGLPDAPNGEVVDLVLKHGIPTVAFTGDFSDDVQEFIWTKRVVDYVLKEGPHSVDYVIALIERLRHNETTKILVVDDSRTARTYLRNLLEVHRYSVLEASDGLEALAVLEDNPEVKLVLTDFQMPGMDGFQLTKRIRAKHGMDELAIIGLSAHGNHRLSVRFMKHGANDFIAKPFLSEQFYCRVAQNVMLIEQFEAIRTLSYTDHVTQLKNRRYFFEMGIPLHEKAWREGSPLVIGMVDVDHFKQVNDNHGHKSGDLVLQRLAEVLPQFFRESDIVSRFGGEEFCILATEMVESDAARVFERLRKQVEDTVFEVPGVELKITVSIGVSCEVNESLEDMIKDADGKLYEAKSSGRNRVVCD